MTSLTANRTPQEKNFFRVQSTRLYAFFETFAELLKRTRAEIFMRKATCVQVFFCRKSPKPAGSPSVNECILKHTVIKCLCYKSTKDILYKMLALSNVTHRNTITEADYFITHITNKKKTNSKIMFSFVCVFL